MLTPVFVDQLSSSQLVPHYLLSSYAYQFLHATYMTDEAYDKLCHRLHAEYDLAHHPHKTLIDKDALQATTGYYLKASQYPTIVRVAAESLIDMTKKGQM